MEDDSLNMKDDLEQWYRRDYKEMYAWYKTKVGDVSYDFFLNAVKREKLQHLGLVSGEWTAEWAYKYNGQGLGMSYEEFLRTFDENKECQFMVNKDYHPFRSWVSEGIYNNQCKGMKFIQLQEKNSKNKTRLENELRMGHSYVRDDVFRIKSVVSYEENGMAILKRKLGRSSVWSIKSLIGFIVSGNSYCSNLSVLQGYKGFSNG